MAPSAGATAYVFHHVALPPKLPQEDDRDPKHERALIEVVIQALNDLRVHVEKDHVGTVLAATATVENLNASRDNFGNISEVQLQDLFFKLMDGGTIGTVPLEVKKQNAGILVSRSADVLNFEFFELSPVNEAAMCSGRLVRTFPGYASKIATTTMASADLRKSISGTLVKMSTQAAPDFQPQVRKNGKMMDEDRDTSHPGMVTDFLMNVITAFGEPTDVNRIKKHTREEVLWSDCLNPWRRSPLWLLVRVSLQLLFTRKAPSALHPDGLYKAFMIFMLARLLNLAKNHWKELGIETIHIISAKLTRRLRKFELLKQTAFLHSTWTQHIQSGVLNARNVIQQHWQELVDNTKANIDTTVVHNLHPEQDLDMQLSGLDEVLTQLASRKRTASLSAFMPTSEYPVYYATELPNSLHGPEEYRHFRLAAFESWVEHNLAGWLSGHLQDVHACEKFRIAMSNYHQSASEAYARAPIGMSIMYLTLAELWVACDKSACAIYPMLAEYDPEILIQEFQCLVLPLKSQMKRLHEVESYVRTRQDRAKKGAPSIYRNFGHPLSFAVRYFEQSQEHQGTLAKIETDAKAKRKRKCEELKNLKHRHSQYMDTYNSTTCEYYWKVVNRYTGYKVERHSGGCARCASKRNAEALQIQIYEWPLSSSPSEAKATVFELIVPEPFSNWRDASYWFITTVLGCKDQGASKPTCSYTLANHQDISHMLPPEYSGRRVVPLSQVKPNIATHRKMKEAILWLNDDDVCLDNALQYAYYDNDGGRFNKAMPTCTEKISKDCMYQMPPRSKVLERFMYHPPSSPEGLPPNEVIASLIDCPVHLSIDEYKALSTLPLGHRIFSSNIIAQLAIPTVDFSKVETQCIILQAAQQVGPSDQNFERASHLNLTEAACGHAILEQLEITLARTEGNWESWRAAASLSLLARRVLSLTYFPEVRSRAFEHLAKLRQVCLRWLLALKKDAAASTEDEQRTELFSHATEVALVCTSTYEVEGTDLDAVLQHGSAISTLLQCSITIQENHGSVKSENIDLYRSTLQSWKSLMYRMCQKLRERILLDSKGLSEAVIANWAAFQPAPTTSWKSLNGSQEHWLWIMSGTLPVHLNLLTGELLVNGLPLARLPSEFMQHPMYTPLFHKSALEVVPTDEAGMKFSAKSKYHGFELHFGMLGADMLVTAIGEDSRLDLLPSHAFQDTLPHAFLANYIHWYDRTKDEVIFRSRESPWQSVAEEWRLTRNKLSRTWRLVKGSNVLLNCHSRSACSLSKLFRTLEDAKHIHINLDTTTRTVDIDLPRLQLNFYIKKHGREVYSRQHRGMIIDSNQSIGALVGLVSKLTLRNEYTAHDRLTLIPVPRTYANLDITYTSSGNHHPTVIINKENATKVYAYTLDKDLGRILDSSELQSRLFLSYLHAITSGASVDPLTKRTGTEAGLEILQSAAVRSFDVLTDENVELLSQIAGLSLSRTFYPSNLRVMQQITWDEKLPSLSQHVSFRLLVSNLLHQATRTQLFYPGNEVFSLITQTQRQLGASTNPYLEQRDAIRNSTFRVTGFGAEGFTASQDVQHSARDQQNNSKRGRRAFLTAKLVLRDRADLHSLVPNLKSGLLRSHFDRASIDGLQNSFDPTALRFDSEWLDNQSDHLKEMWCTLQQALANPSAGCNRYDMTFFFTCMAFAKSADMDAIQALVAFYRIPDFVAIRAPSAPIFELARGHTWEDHQIRTILHDNAKSFDDSAEARLPKEESEDDEKHNARIQLLFHKQKDNAIRNCLNALEKQWPVRSPSMPVSSEHGTYLNLSSAITKIQETFEHWFNNRLFMEYLAQLSSIVARQKALGVPEPQYSFTPPIYQNSVDENDRTFSARDIFAASPNQNALQSLTPPCEPDVLTDQTSLAMSLDAKDRLENLCDRLETCAKSKCEQDYIESLRSSCAALDEHSRTNHAPKQLLPSAQNLLQEYLNDCQKYLDDVELALEHSLKANASFSEEIGLCIERSPRISATFWLSQLHRDRFYELSEPWKDAMIEYALAITKLQRAQRLLRLSDKAVDLVEELRHTGHTNWDVHDYPETLLLEAESAILVRKEQEYIASHMRSPKDGQNIVLQLLMGGGKSTTIVPILSTYLGDKKKLIRVVVAKPQSKQMLQMLVVKLGGLLGRRVFQLPFSRNLRLNVSDARTIREIYEECIKCRGVLLIQPEHILSFKLMAIECVLIEQQDIARSLLSTQGFLDQNSVDIVDESDSNFSVTFELIYTIGEQQSIDFAPERYNIIQEIMGLLPRFALQVKESLPEAVEVQTYGDGRFPRIRFLRPGAADEILSLIAHHIVEFGIIGLPSQNQSPRMQASILRYISEMDLSAEDVQAVEQSKFWTESTKSPLLLVRGLLAGGVLRFVFTQKRWRVNFGLDVTRDPSTSLAVPYRSKDSPSPRSEFSHPDVVILLTQLSFYYGGLTDDELFDTLTHVQKSDQAAIHYDEFVNTASSSLPTAFRQHSGVPLKNRHQCITEVFPALRHSKKAVDYYLACLIFPKQLKQFPEKLSASGWDLAAKKKHATTGFSGTNDTHHLLPLDIKQLDLPSQAHTNAQVLSYLLMDETSVELLPTRTSPTASDGEHLLTFIEKLDSDIRVMLDCGASILEQNNRQVATTWLKLRGSDIQAVVYFEDEQLSVLDRTGRIESFQTSPFAKMLDICIIYLDESHTRGTDLKLPRHYKAALTLGAALTKDALTQGAMRMRKLGYGQSITFIVSAEIKTKIYERTCKPLDSPIEVSDVLSWSIGETWSDLKRSIPLWAVQGQRFESHRHLMNGAHTTQDEAKAFLEDEAQNLEVRYKPRAQGDDGSAYLRSWDISSKNIAQIVSKCRDFETMGFSSAALSEEQERELAPEIEEERQVERPPRMEAHPHSVHPDLERLVRDGSFLFKSKAWGPAFQALCTTTAGKLIDLTNFPNDLLVTADFMHTVQPPPGSTRASFILDSYQQTVQFILSVPSSQHPGTIRNLIVISPYEANQLLPLLREHNKVTLHLFSPRSNVSFASLDKLLLYNVGHPFSAESVSRSLTLQLNIFAGSLYLRSFSEYHELCDYLGLLRGKAKDGQQVYADGFIDPPAGTWGLKQSPVPFLRALLMRIRREGEGVNKTHMGRVLNGIRLEEGEFEEQK